MATETVNSTAKLGRSDALKLAAGASTVVVVKRGSVVSFAMKQDPPDDKTLLTHMLGPTGNLRAPTIKAGNTLLVGFDEKSYEKYL